MNIIRLNHTSNCPDEILSFMTERTGGNSSGVYSSLNFGLNTDDDSSAVEKNYEAICRTVGMNAVTVLNQVHGNIVYDVTAENNSSIHRLQGDGLFTAEKNIALGVLTADCFPVHIWGKRCVSVIHCGWRSLNSGIIENTLKLFAAYNDFDLGAYIGAGICKNCYQVRQDMVDQLNAAYNPESALVRHSEGVYMLDLKMLVLNALKYNGINNTEYSDKSSCCSDAYFSHRRDKGVTGRMISVIMRKQ